MGTPPRILKPSKWFSQSGLFKLSLDICRRSPKSSPSPSPSFNGGGSVATSTAYSTSIMSPRNGRRSAYKEEELIKDVFRHFDGDGDGKISAYELRDYFGSIGEYISHEEAQQVITALDSDGDDFLDLQDFMSLMMKESASGGHHEEDLRKAFEMFELEKGSGCITPKSLQVMLRRLGDTKTYDECVAMIQFYDADGNGVLDFSEFQKMMA